MFHLKNIMSLNLSMVCWTSWNGLRISFQSFYNIKLTYQILFGTGILRKTFHFNRLWKFLSRHLVYMLYKASDRFQNIALQSSFSFHSSTSFCHGFILMLIWFGIGENIHRLKWKQISEEFSSEIFWWRELCLRVVV